MTGISNLKPKSTSDYRLNSGGSLRLTPHYTSASTYSPLIHIFMALVLSLKLMNTM
jgi:hypothetical protein